jgi:phage-related protein
MNWKVDFYNDSVKESILEMLTKIQARMLWLLDLIEKHGANLGAPHTEAMGDGLFEIRVKAQEGIGRSLYCYMSGKHIVVLNAFVKKSQKTPSSELNLAKRRMKEVKRK